MKNTRRTRFSFIVIAALVLFASLALVNCGGGGGGGGAATAKTSVKLARTGQINSFDANATQTDDGALRIGVAWPAQRFTPVSSGTGTVVSDNLTGLMWAGDGGTPAFDVCAGGTKNWQAALDYVACLNTNNYLGHNDWRLPNRNELRSLAHFGQSNVAAWLNSQGFNSVQTNVYWSSTTVVGYMDSAWTMHMQGVYPIIDTKSSGLNYVWPVRAGQ